MRRPIETLARPRGYTLVELLVVIGIILIVSVLALGTINFTYSSWAVDGAAATLQAAITASRDTAARMASDAPAAGGITQPGYSPPGPNSWAQVGLKAPNEPKEWAISGIRLIPDPTRTDCYSSFVECRPGTSYSDGLVSIRPGRGYPFHVTGGRSCLVLEQAVVAKWVKDANGRDVPEMAPPTYWSGNIRQGERVRVGPTGQWYTVIGPEGPDGSETIQCLPFTRDYRLPDGRTYSFQTEYLLLVNGLDDDGDGIADNGWDGFDNDGDRVADNPEECEPEAWQRNVAGGVEASTYVIQRRPYPVPGASAVNLPKNVVVSFGGSRLPVPSYRNPIDLMFYPDGRPAPSGKYGTPPKLPMEQKEGVWRLFLCNREETNIYPPPSPARYVVVTKNGRCYTEDL